MYRVIELEAICKTSKSENEYNVATASAQESSCHGYMQYDTLDLI